jgi:hypothetical protein
MVKYENLERLPITRSFPGILGAKMTGGSRVDRSSPSSALQTEGEDHYETAPSGRRGLKTFLSTISLAALAAVLVAVVGVSDKPYRYSECANNNSEACRDARDAFARRHSGQSPEQWYEEWYQGQQGRWTPKANNWQWEGAEGDEWFQGVLGHWYREQDGWQFLADDGQWYRRGSNGWQWSGARQKSNQAGLRQFLSIAAIVALFHAQQPQ